MAYPSAFPGAFILYLSSGTWTMDTGPASSYALGRVWNDGTVTYDDGSGSYVTGPTDQNITGSEEITNGDFPTDLTGWTDVSTGTGTAAVSGAELVLTGDGTSTNQGAIQQTLSGVTAGQHLWFAATLSNVRMFLDGTEIYAGEYAVAQSATPVLKLTQGLSASNGTADDVSAKEVVIIYIAGRMVRASGSTTSAALWNQFWAVNGWVFGFQIEDTEDVYLGLLLADLKAKTGMINGDVVHLVGNTAVGDGLQGDFVYKVSSTDTADDVDIITAAGVGRWHRNDEHPQILDVRKFGATGDGTTDDTTALDDAFTEASTLGVPAYLPEGTYSFSSLTLAAGTVIKGAGQGNSILECNSSVTNAISFNGDGCQLHHLTCDANGDQPSSYLLRVNSNVDDTLINDCELTNTGGNNTTGSLTLVETRDNAEFVTVQNSYLHDFADGIRINRGAKNVKILNNRIESYGLRGIYGLGSSVATSKYITIEGNRLGTPLAGNVKYPIQMNGVTYEIQYVTIRGNTLIGPDLAYDNTTPTSNTATADQIAVQGVRFFNVSDNVSLFGGDVGITVSQGSKDGLVANNYVSEGDSAGIAIGASSGSRTDNIHVSGNYVLNSGQDRDTALAATSQIGIWVENTNNVSLDGNFIVDNQGTATMEYAVRVKDCTNFRRGQNVYSGSGTDDFYEAGTNSFVDSPAYVSRLVIPRNSSTLTIASGAITASGSYHRVETESLASTDDLDTINGGVDGMRLILRTVGSSRDVVVKHNTGNIYLGISTADVTLALREQTIELVYDGLLSKWLEVSS